MKKELREHIANLLSGLDQNEYLEKSRSLAQNLEDFIVSILSKSSLQKFAVAGFIPMRKEPLWFFNSSLMFERGILSLPRIDGPFQMTFIQVEWKGLIERKLNWKSELQGLKTEKFDLILVPGLAFDQMGGRLGRGKGFYDRFLNQQDSLKIGICFEEQLVEKVPSDTWDIRMDYIVTNQRLIKCKGDK